jgi:hypothetical protein
MANDKEDGSNKIKRPLNAYMEYCKDHRDKIKDANPTAKAKEIVKILADDYNKLDPKLKKKYTDAYEKKMLEFKKANDE